MAYVKNQDRIPIYYLLEPCQIALMTLWQVKLPTGQTLVFTGEYLGQ